MRKIQNKKFLLYVSRLNRLGAACSNIVLALVAFVSVGAGAPLSISNGLFEFINTGTSDDEVAVTGFAVES